MKTTITGQTLQRLLEASDWGESLNETNVKAKIEAILAQPGGRRKLWLYISRLSSFAQMLKDVKVEIEVTEAQG